MTLGYGRHQNASFRQESRYFRGLTRIPSIHIGKARQKR